MWTTTSCAIWTSPGTISNPSPGACCWLVPRRRVSMDSFRIYAGQALGHPKLVCKRMPRGFFLKSKTESSNAYFPLGFPHVAVRGFPPRCRTGLRSRCMPLRWNVIPTTVGFFLKSKTDSSIACIPPGNPHPAPPRCRTGPISRVCAVCPFYGILSLQPWADRFNRPWSYQCAAYLTVASIWPFRI
jgi:hypothetical protein